MDKEKSEELNLMVTTVFNNLKLYIDQKFKELEEPFQLLEDTKINVSTLSTLLHTKDLFSQEEFRDCFREMRNSFGIVKSDGTMDGQVAITRYNF